MAEDIENIENSENDKDNSQSENTELVSDNNFSDNNGGISKIVHLSGLYKDWFLDYASYVILERAVPHLADGLKPVQRRILHSMKKLDDGRYNKVANIIGHTMQFHPHGDASIGDALVQLGQKDLLIDTQGNWGNLYTGDRAAAPRYIEARLSGFANDIVFNPKTTTYKLSYDGRNKEPVTLPVKFPLLLAQGVEGIAVGLASKILPHNFIELIDAAINYLQESDFEIYPDFYCGGLADFSKYNDGLRGGSVKIRAKISKLDKKDLVITEIPFGTTTSLLIDSIIKANDNGKIKIKKIDDNTAENVEIIIQVVPGVSLDKTIDALYAFTACQVSISPNACVIDNNKPVFIGVKEMLKISVDNTVKLHTKELQILKRELEEELHYATLEKVFIEKKIYQQIENCKTWESIIETIDNGLKPYEKYFVREVTKDDIIRLTEIKIKRISKFNSFKEDEHIKTVESNIEEVTNHLENIIPYTINFFKQIKKKYGKGKERKTEIRNFDTIEATKVVAANEKLYVNRYEGFFGTSLKKDEYVCECSDIDDIIVFMKDGKYLVTKVQDKSFAGKNIIHIAVYNRNDDRTIYNVAYRDGKNGNIFVKRFAVTGITRDKQYDVTKGSDNSKILYFSANPNGEAEVIKIFLKPKPKLKKLVFNFDFSELAIKGRNSIGNILTKHDAHKITLKEQGLSTLGGRDIYFDFDVLRLNIDGRGELLGEFSGDDRILVITKSGYYKLYTFDLENHFEENILKIEKYNPKKIFSAVYFDAEQNFYYLKRFNIEETEKLVSIIGEHQDSRLIEITEDKYPQLKIKFGGNHKDKEDEIINVEEFIGIKSYKAKGKRLSKYEIDSAFWIEPIIKEEEILEDEINVQNNNDETAKKESKNEMLNDMDVEVKQMKLDL